MYYFEERTLDVPVKIKHFLPSEESKKIKTHDWYLNNDFMEEHPLNIAKRDGWKQYNPQRDNYEG